MEFPKQQEINLYDYLKQDRTKNIVNVRDDILSITSSVLSLARNYQSYIYNKSDDETPNETDINDSSIDFLSNVYKIFQKTDYLKYLTDEYSDNIPKSKNGELEKLLEINDLENSLNRKFSKEYLSSLSTEELEVLTSFYSNRFEKYIGALSIYQMGEVFDIYTDYYSDKKLYILFSKGKDAYIDLENNADCENLPGFGDTMALPNLDRFLEQHGISKDRKDEFLYAMSLYKLQDSLYTIKDKAIFNLIKRSGQSNIDKTKLRIYREVTYNTSNNANIQEESYRKQLQRIFVICRGFCSPLIMHIPKEDLDSYLIDNNIEIEYLGKDCPINKVMNKSYLMLYKLDDKTVSGLCKLDTQNSDRKISNYRRLILPTDEDIERENNAKNWVR